MADLSSEVSSSDGSPRASPEEPTHKNLGSALAAVNLDIDYWLATLKIKFGVTDYGQLRFIDIPTFEDMKKCVRHSWEANALKELLGIENTYEKFQNQRKQEEKKKEDEAKKLLSDMQSLQDEGKKRTDELVKEKEERLRQVLNVSKEDWIKGFEDVTLDEILSKFKGDLGELDQSVSDRYDLSANELLEKASGGLALKGTLITNNDKECSELRRVVIEVPKDAYLKAPISKQREDVVEFASRLQADLFQRSLDTFGHGVATGTKGGSLGFQSEIRFSEKRNEEEDSESETHGREVYLFREMYSYVPTAVCEFNPLTLKLCENVLAELKKLELLIEGTESKTSVHNKCEDFFRKYGSHVNVGIIQFGGIYEWIASYSSATASSKEVVKNMVQEALNGFVSMTFSGSGISSGGSISGDQVKNHAGTARSCDNSELSNVSLHLTKKGGPQEVTSLPLWKMGLSKYNSTWAVIDRGNDFTKDFVGIWQLIHNHTNHFRHAARLADTLQNVWWLMSGMPPSCLPENDKILVAIESMNSLLELVQEWTLDDNLSSNAIEYLQKLLNQVEQMCTDTGDCKHWVDMLKNDKQISIFLSRIIHIEKQYSPDHLPHIQYLLRKLAFLAEQNDFPNRKKILAWVKVSSTDEYLPSILKVGPIQNIPSLNEAITKTLLPAMQIAHVKAKVAGKSGDEIDIQATVDLALAVDHLRTQMEYSGKQYELFLLLSALKELTFDPSRKSFDVLLTEDRLRKFIQRLENIWIEFESFRNTGSMKLQAFLIHFLVTSVSAVDSPLHKEQQFTEAIEGIQDLLTSEMNLVLAQFATHTPYDWDKLSTTLTELKNGNQEILQSQAVDIRDLEEITNQNLQIKSMDVVQRETCVAPNGETPAGKLLQRLGLIKYYPSKISLQDVMAIGHSPQEDDYLASNLPWIILRKLVMLDYNGRDGDVGKVASGTQARASDNPEDDEDGAFSTIDDILSGFDTEEVDNVALNPLDVLITTYSCCDLILQQTLMQKMFMCRLAVPFIIPKLANDLLKYSLWALRSIVVDWRNEDGEAIETSIVSQPTKVVSFVRLGRPAYSKSTLLNHVLSDQTHHTFWNKDCPQGHSTPHLSNGLVEAEWYLPGGKATDTFKDVTMFLNLRGDACEHPTQLQILNEISNVIVCCIETSDLENPEILEKMRTIHGSSSKIVLLLVAKEIGSLNPQILRKQLEQYVTHIGKENMANAKQISGFRGNKEKNTDDLKHEVREAVTKLLQGQQGRSIESASLAASTAGIDIDENDELCLKGKHLAEEVIKCMEGKSTNECKKEMLPLQGDDWQEWSKLQRKKQRSGSKDIQSNIIHDMAVIQQRMTHLRQNQLQDCNNLSPLIKTFFAYLIQIIDSPAAILYLQWLKLKLDDISRKTLPGLHSRYHNKWISFKSSRDTAGESSDETEMLKSELEEAERLLAGASLGLEHLFREVSQIYEAAIESNLKLKESTSGSVEQLPEIAAKLLLKGQPMEIMDGDASNVPLTWVKSVFASLLALVGDKKLFVVSVLGIQSSGKSTLLNTMFGLQFAVSAGRCTRGVYMQLIKVNKAKADLPYEYVLVIDTEGLRALELGHVKHTHDNELATLVIGLGDVTIMNIKGENVAEMKDVLQIAVHAFLRMKITNQNFQLHRTCVFIHQNVPAINAREKMRHGCQKLQESLDEMTTEACAIENIADVHTFNQVIDFDGQRHVWYFSDLWHGDPPMAPTNPGYTEKVQDVKSCLFDDLSRKQKTFLGFSDMILRIEDLWKGVMADDFVFSFRNSLAAKAYNSLELTYYELTWTVESGIMEWLNQTAIMQLERCTTSEELEKCCSKLLIELEKEVSGKQEGALLQLRKFFETNNLRDIVIQWQAEKIGSLNSDTRAFRNRARREILQKKDSLRIDLLQKVTQEKHEVEIMRKAKELADTMKGNFADDDELHAKFDCVWIQWLNELATRTATTHIPIEIVVEQILWQRLAKDSAALRKELRRNPLSKPLQQDMLEGSIKVGTIKQSHVSVRTSVGQNIKSFFTGNDPWLQCRHTAVQAIDIILRKVDVYLKDLCKQDSKFHESYATYVIKNVVDGVQEHNQQYTREYPFTLLPNLMVKLAVHSCRHAVVVFNKMQKEYEENHGIAKKLDTYKNTAWNLFKNTVNQSTKEVVAADLLYDRLEELAKKTVKRRMTGDVLEEKLHFFGHQKHNLILNILDDLALKGCFENYRSFLTNSKDYALKWLTSFTNDTLFSSEDGTKSAYANYARKHIREIAQCMEKSIRAATESVTKHPSAGIKLWAKEFCVTLTKLPITEGDLKHMMEQDVGDFQNLERLLMDRLLALEERILSSFTTETAETIKWEGKTPYRQIIDKLWGCEAQCPFCNEPCQRTDPKHASKHINHQCIQHRPSGVGGDKWDETFRQNKLVVESCNYQVQCKGLKFNCRDCKFECRKSEYCSSEGADWHYHDNMDYKSYLPEWDIAPSSSMESSKYWMWFMATYQHQLKNMYNAGLPDIPESWRDITVHQAIDSLRMYSN